MGMKKFNPRGPFTSGQIARMFHVAPRTAAKWIDKGVIVGYRLPLCLDRRATRQSIESFLSANPTVPRPEELGVEVDAGTI